MLAEKMGGKIELESKANEGSRFFFSIETDYQNGEKIPNGSLGMIKRILVIDDNDNNRLILEQLLKSWNIEFTGTDNGLSALKIINTSPAFDVIIVDYNMPYLNGMDTIKMIRDKLDLSPEKMPVILLYSSSEDAEIHEKCRELGIKFQLTKPVKTSQLMNLLKRIHNPAQSASETEKSGTETQRIKPDNAEKIRVLIAEDIPTNMALAEIVIRSVLPEAIIIKAENGLKTLEAYREQQPQIIFMDVQMPVMDGLLATEKIREIEQETKIRVPIIALTAGALKEEEQKCHEAGMDDFMTKPFKQQLVREILEKHLNIQT
jgi:CheY-like chemotaxis protein